jgi:transposase
MATKARKPEPPVRAPRRVFSAEFRREAVQMMLDGHSAASVAERLGLAGTNLLYRWKRDELVRTGPVATSLEGRIRELEIELHRVERERDILKKALAIFGRNE